MTVVGFAGMTHLGLVSATAVASRGFRTICYDNDSDLVGRLQQGKLHILEPDLDDLLRANGAMQSFTADVAALSFCDVVYIAPDVPTDDEGRSDTTRVRALIATVADVLKPTGVMVVLSQVEPGFTRSLATPPPERRYYQVETLVFGRAVERATKPERYIIGCAEPAAALDPHFKSLLAAFDCPILPMRYESAELAKISINFCLVASVWVANTLSEVCEHIGADWSEIAPALKLDRRIGAYSYLAPGLGIAGGNLERDLATVRRIADVHGTDAGFVHATLANSRYRRDWPLRVLHERVLSRVDNPVVGILGVAYKENTHSIKNSPSVALIKRLGGVALRVFDPAVRPAPEWHNQTTIVEDMESVCDGADALVIMTPWPAFRSLVPAEIRRRMRGKIVIDPYGVLDRKKIAEVGLSHAVLGVAAKEMTGARP